jgi:hypothetical protein
MALHCRRMTCLPPAWHPKARRGLVRVATAAASTQRLLSICEMTQSVCRFCCTYMWHPCGSAVSRTSTWWSLSCRRMRLQAEEMGPLLFVLKHSCVRACMRCFFNFYSHATSNLMPCLLSPLVPLLPFISLATGIPGRCFSYCTANRDIGCQSAQFFCLMSRRTSVHSSCRRRIVQAGQQKSGGRYFRVPDTRQCSQLCGRAGEWAKFADYFFIKNATVVRPTSTLPHE